MTVSNAFLSLTEIAELQHSGSNCHSVVMAEHDSLHLSHYSETHRTLDKLAPEPVAGPQHLHLLKRHSLGLRQEEGCIDGHQAGPEGKEEVCAPLQPADR